MLFRTCLEGTPVDASLPFSKTFDKFQNMAARRAYSPVSVNDTGQARALRRAESQTSVTKPRRLLSVWTFSLIIIGLCVLFLLGFCLGFYVRESQSQVTDVEDSNKCDGVLQDDSEESKLAMVHEDIMYRIRGEHVRKFWQEFSYQDPVSNSQVEHILEQHVHQVLEQQMLDDFHVEEHEVVVTYCDPNQPNHIQVFDKSNNTVLVDIRLVNEPVGSDIANSTASLTTTEDWKYPFVTFSPAGIAEGTLLYGHYGSEADLLVLQAKGISLKKRVVLLRVGRLSLAEKVKNVADEGATGVLVYWDPADAGENPDTPSNISFVPYASAAVYTTDSTHLWVPSIPVQTISMETASLLLQILSREEGSVVAPSAWLGGLQVIYSLGRKYSNGNITVRLTTFNKDRQLTVKNFVASIHGTSEKDRYVVVGAPRAALPGTAQDAVISTSLLLQLASSLNTAHSLKKWKPRRGIRLISWGGADLANIGMLQHIHKHHHLLSRRAVAYFDISRLMVGTDIITARVPPGLFQVVNEVTLVVPDPNNADSTIQSSWQEILADGKVDARSAAIPLASYHGDQASSPLLHIAGVPTISLQYRNMGDRPADGLSVSTSLEIDNEHYYKYHVAIMRMMVQILVSMVDDEIIPYSLSGTVTELSTILWQTSELLDQCSHSMQDLEDSLNMCSELEETARVFEEFIAIYVKKGDILSLRMVNDIKMMFDRLFIAYRKGIPRHILYPVDVDNNILEIVDLCSTGGIADVWNKTQEFADTMKMVLSQAVLALRASN